ncbi:probable N-acetyltransferase HLS1 [Herrania umbratica]|uniref:Probable N-acetyltransferase HLS1 n=1 Tax=Herrania umbratica TaxID=108875 RepID=A0A6J1AXQ5_9ROSI|nr:probable N-acetyltransferase HLS1 [Herrania umbratica]
MHQVFMQLDDVEFIELGGENRAGERAMVDNIEDKVLVREFDDGRDIEVVGKLQKNCEIGSNNKGASIFTNMTGDPLCRIRFYPLHLMLVAELRENRELVGVIRGCIKHVGTKFGGTHVKLGCILGLRVSPRHRRMGIGLKLVRAIEEWLINNGAHYTFLATEKNNVASTNLFTAKCNYRNLSSLVIFVQPIISFAMEGLSQDIKVEKLSTDQALSLYDNKLRGKDIYLTDIDAILKEKLSLGTWVSYFKQDEWIGLHSKEKDEDIISTSPRSWAMFSIWNSCETFKIHIKKSHPLKFFHATLSHARDKIFPCLKIPICDSLEKPFGFLFLYGLHGEGARLGELMKSAWSFASRLAENVKDCKVIITELGFSDPLIEHVPNESSMSRIDDLWYLKKVNGSIHEENDLGMMGELGNVVVDPRDF